MGLIDGLKETSRREIIALIDADQRERVAEMLRKIPGYPWLPCPICRGMEGCDHAVPERARAALGGL
jgi:hypothetical protein